MNNPFTLRFGRQPGDVLPGYRYQGPTGLRGCKELVEVSCEHPDHHGGHRLLCSQPRGHEGAHAHTVVCRPDLYSQSTPTG